MKTFKLITSFISILSLLVLFSLTVFASTSIEESTKSIVRVISKTNTKSSLGSGFAIGKPGNSSQYFASNNHVVELNYDEVYIIYSDKEPVSAKVIAYNSEKDLAVLKVEKPIKQIIPFIFANTNKVSVTQKIHTLGFPALYDLIHINEGLGNLEANPEDVTIGTGTINRKDIINNTKTFVHDSKISQGNSGGPLISESSEVIGINTFIRGTSDAENDNNNDLNVIYSESVSIDELISLLKKENIPYQISSKNSISGSNSNNLSSSFFTSFRSKLIVIIIIIIAISSLIVLFIIIKLLKMQKKSSNHGNLENIYSEQDQPELNQQNYDVSNENTLHSKTVVINQSNRNIYLEGINGHFSGERIPFKNDSIIIGRSKSKANLIYPDSFSDISGVHCIIKYNRNINKISILDKSTNGTFLKNNNRIEKGISTEVSLNDEFYLSTDANSFRFVKLN
ncbi:MAG: trypsin-like peptidase domain-containing protein [Clostridiales bacterium]